ncbi:hypothetical protein [Sphingomonas hankookensis]|uniref:DUF937 domain-containing protein n=1 Tax=Sphingomonas hengshuiensis TaxID=1609977 RepID=A0A2W5BEJ6_9SPHN|nr:MAG: hypothetical protein DI632_04145 [Sphingomonas hengshuiensis]
MDLLNNALNLAGRFDLPAIAEKAGISGEQVQTVLGLLARFAGHADPAQEAADHSGVSRHQIEAILSEVGGPDALGQFAQLLGLDVDPAARGGIGDLLPGGLGGLLGRK